MKRIVSIFLSILFVFGTMACTATPAASSKTEVDQPAQKTEQEVVKNEMNTDFCKDLIGYLNQLKYAEENYIVSPTSFRAALCLAIAGAKGQTRDELLKAAGFGSIEEANAWYDGISESVKDFREDLEQENQRYAEWLEEARADRAFSVVNSVWNNSDNLGDFLESYKKYVEEHYGAEAKSVSADQITAAVNNWCNEKTNGMIPSIADDLSTAASVLVNALYLRTTWVDTFESYYTAMDTFTCIDGSKTEKEFMQQTEDMLYYENNGTKLVVLSMKGDKQFVCVLGNGENVEDMIAKAEYEKVHVKIPKLDIESSFSDSELVDYLMSKGVVCALDASKADFSGMADFPWFIRDIIQKAKIKTDEDGLEAAAVTAIVMETAGYFEPEQREIKEFIADQPFTFYVYSGLFNENTEMLFYGQCVR